MEALKAAVQADNLQDALAALEALQQQGNNYSITDYLLRLSISNKNEAMVAALLAARSLQADISPPSSYTLHEAIRAMDFPIIRLLLNNGYAPFDGGATALHWAAETGNIALLEFFWQLATNKGISIDVENSVNATPLYYAAESGKSVCVRFLLERGASVNHISPRCGSAFLRLLIGAHTREAAEEVKTITELFVDFGLDLQQFSPSRRFSWVQTTPLMEASVFGVKRAIEVLLNAGARVNAVAPKTLYTALHLAMISGHSACATLLLRAGADVNAKRVGGITPMHDWSFYDDNGNLKALEYLYQTLSEKGADFNIKNDAAPERESCLHLLIRGICEHSEWDERRRRLFYNGSDCEDDDFFDEYGSVAIPDTFLESGKRVSKIIDSLTRAGANAASRNSEGLTALQIMPLQLCAPLLDAYKVCFAPIIVSLINAGDFHSWGSVPKGCPGIERAMEAVWERCPEELYYLFKKMSSTEQQRVRMMLKCINRCFSSQQLRMLVLTKALSF